MLILFSILSNYVLINFFIKIAHLCIVLMHKTWRMLYYFLSTQTAIIVNFIIGYIILLCLFCNCNWAVNRLFRWKQKKYMYSYIVIILIFDRCATRVDLSCIAGRYVCNNNFSSIYNTYNDNNNNIFNTHCIPIVSDDP